MLLGIYKYKSTILFVDFDTSNYISRKAHNSSAHVYTIDLKNGSIFGVFQKEDFNKNIITVIRTDHIEKYLDKKLSGKGDLRLDFVVEFDDFYKHLPKKWQGINAYTEMLNAKFNNALQPEWPGFYHEFKFNEFIKNNDIKDIEYHQNKKKDEIDLDLFFPAISSYGDLKTHSNDSSGIQGNDFDTIMKLLDTSSIYYVVLNHNTEKDIDFNSEVTIFWNKKLNKTNLLSYAKKMKHAVLLTSYCILEINKYNKQYLQIFHQGVNSNGKPRNPKISIKTQNINNFLIHQLVL